MYEHAQKLYDTFGRERVPQGACLYGHGYFSGFGGLPKPECIPDKRSACERWRAYRKPADELTIYDRQELSG